MRANRFTRQNQPREGSKRFSLLDPDIAPRDFADDPDARGTRFALKTIHKHLGTKEGLAKNRQLFATVAGRNASLIHQIRIPHGKTFGMMWLFKQIGARVDDFKPILPTIDSKGWISFYIQSADVAAAVVSLSRRIKHNLSDSMVRMHKNLTAIPWKKLTRIETDFINEVVDSRFNSQVRSLDLQDFGEDEKFVSKNKSFRLTSNQVMLAVLDRIDSHYGHITALNLKHNHLMILDCVAMLTWATKFVTVLDLSDNEIKSMEELRKLQGLPLETLFLQGNTLCDDYSIFSNYVKAVQDIFPAVSLLDGISVTAKAKTSNLSQNKEPLFQPSYSANQHEACHLINKFVIEYYALYDSDQPKDDRKKLIAAYHPTESVFSFSMCDLESQDSTSSKLKHNDPYAPFQRKCRNLKLAHKQKGNSTDFVFYGSEKISEALANLPKTKHFKESFIVDLSFVQNDIMAFSISGLCADSGYSSDPRLRYFSRQFVVMPSGPNTMVVVSDILFVAEVQYQRAERVKSLLKLAKKHEEAPQAPIVPSGPDAATKAEMIQNFSYQSGMNAEWSERCLIENNWNYDVAAQCFVQNRESLPAEAFAAAH